MKLYYLGIAFSVGYPEYDDGETPTGRNRERKGKVTAGRNVILCKSCVAVYERHTLSYVPGQLETLGVRVKLQELSQGTLPGTAKCLQCGAKE